MLVADSFFFVVCQDQSSSARQAIRNLLQSFRFPLSGFFITQRITHLDSQLVFWNIEIHFITVIIEKHAPIVDVLALYTHQLDGHKILQKHSVLIDKEQAQNTVIYEIVFTVTFLISKR